MMKHCWVYVLISIGSWSCNDYTPKEFVKYITDKDHGMRNDIRIGSYHYVVQFFPVEYKALLEEGHGRETDIMESMERYQDGIYFNLKVLDSTIYNEEGVKIQSTINFTGQTYNQINFWFEPMVNLVVNDDTLRCRLSHLEPLSTHSNAFNFSLVFDKSENYFEAHRGDSLYFVFNDIFWSKNEVVSGFLVDDLLNRPSLKI